MPGACCAVATMILLGQALYTFLSTYAPLTALVGTRIYPGMAPSSAIFPYVTLQDLSVESHYHLEGASGTHDTLVQVDCWALSALESRNIAKVIRLSMDGLQAAWSTLEIDGVFIDSELDAPELAADGSERMFHRRILNLNVWSERDIPA